MQRHRAVYSRIYKTLESRTCRPASTDGWFGYCFQWGWMNHSAWSSCHTSYCEYTQFSENNSISRCHFGDMRRLFILFREGWGGRKREEICRKWNLMQEGRRRGFFTPISYGMQNMWVKYLFRYFYKIFINEENHSP